MGHVFASVLKAFRQIADPAVLRVLGKSLAVTLAVFVVMGAGLYFGLRVAFEYSVLSGGGFGSAVAAIAIAALAFWFLFRIVALAVLQFFADEIVAAVEARHYPEAAKTAKPLPLRQEVTNSLWGFVRATGYNLLALPIALALSFTGIGTALVFVAVNAVLLGRELTDMAWLRHCDPAKTRQTPVPWSQRFVLGAVIAAGMLVPVLALLAPVIGAAAGTHLAHRAMAVGRNREKGDGNVQE